MTTCISLLRTEINADIWCKFFRNMYHQSLANTSLYNYEKLLNNRREKPAGNSLYEMATLFWKKNVLITLTFCLCAIDWENILGIFPMARRGHQVTVFSPFPEKNPIQNVLILNLNCHTLNYHRILVSITSRFNISCIKHSANLTDRSCCSG